MILNPAYDFLKADYENPNLNGGIVRKVEKGEGKSRVFAYSSIVSFFITPINAFATTGDTFNNIYEIVMRGLDFGFVLVCIFAGVNWMMGHRGRAMEILLGNIFGYLLAIHAGELRDFLKAI